MYDERFQTTIMETTAHYLQLYRAQSAYGSCGQTIVNASNFTYSMCMQVYLSEPDVRKGLSSKLRVIGYITLGLSY